MNKELLEQRYEDLRQIVLAMGSFLPDEKMNLLQILHHMNPVFKQHLNPYLFLSLELIEDQKLYIEKLESALSNEQKIS